jgi:hypothetical protein
VIPVDGCSSFAVSLDGRPAKAVALDAECQELGPAETRIARGLVYVTPVPGAFSYILEPTASPAVSLSCPRDKVVPGETLTVAGETEHTFRVPSDASSGDRLWQRFEDKWIDFTVVPLADMELQLDDSLILQLTPHLASAQDAKVSLSGSTQTMRLVPERADQLAFPFDRPETEEVREISLSMVAGDLAYQRSWWLKAEDGICSIAQLPTAFKTGQCLRGEQEKPLDGTTRASVHWTERTCGEKAKPCLFMHPPYVGGVGYSYALFDPLELPQEPAAALRLQIGKGDGSDPGDGILFRVAVIDSSGKETIVAEKQWIQHAWTPIEAELSAWAGKRVGIKLIADVGPADNSSGDWACWADMRIESAQAVLASTLHEEPITLSREPGPYPADKLDSDGLRQAKSGTLHFQGIGLQHGGQYISLGLLNDVPLGPLPAAGGNEQEGLWSDASLPLSPEALATLTEWNRFTIQNPGQDWFKIRRAWIELELSDGRKASSQVTTTVFTQPPEWDYTEGEGVPFETDIEFLIRFKQ